MYVYKYNYTCIFQKYFVIVLHDMLAAMCVAHIESVRNTCGLPFAWRLFYTFGVWIEEAEGYYDTWIFFVESIPQIIER